MGSDEQASARHSAEALPRVERAIAIVPAIRPPPEEIVGNNRHSRRPLAGQYAQVPENNEDRHERAPSRAIRQTPAPAFQQPTQTHQGQNASTGDGCTQHTDTVRVRRRALAIAPRRYRKPRTVAQTGVPLFCVCPRNAEMMRWVISPGLPVPIGRSSRVTIGITSAAVPVRNASSAVYTS